MRGADSNGGTLPDPLLGIADSAGYLVSYDDETGWGHDALLHYTPYVSGTYYVAVGSYWYEDTGSYTLSMNEITPDSFFAWYFIANSGDSWGGHFYADSQDYAAGQSWTTAYGRYVISSESQYGYDLTASTGLTEGLTYTTWYTDAASGQTLSTYSAGAYATGRTGPGGEYDYAWTGSAWDDFGANGYHQADGDLPDSIFGWRFVANSGDVYGGHFFDDSRDYAAGNSWTTTSGRYEIVSESQYGYDLGPGAHINEGQTYTTWYFDAATGQTLSTYSAGRYATSQTGLGTEYDHAWTGSGWDDFGYAGYHQADADQPDSYFTWYFVANSGDIYGGHFYDDSRDYAAGQNWTTAQGRYVISGEYEYGIDLSGPYGIAEGSTYTTWYDDDATGQVLSTNSAGRYATSTSGLGTEYDHAWTGTNWDDFGYGGYHQVGQTG